MESAAPLNHSLGALCVSMHLNLLVWDALAQMRRVTKNEFLRPESTVKEYDIGTERQNATVRPDIVIQ